jgi:hypothetical protein
VTWRNEGFGPQIEDNVVEMLGIVCPIRDNVTGFIPHDEIGPKNTSLRLT